MVFLPYGLSAVLFVIIAIINHQKDYKRYALLIGLTAVTFLVMFYYEKNYGHVFDAKDCLIASTTLIFAVDCPISIKENNEKSKK